MDRILTTVLTLVFAVSALLATDTPGVGMLGVTVAALLLAALVCWRTGDQVALSRVCTTSGPVGEERCLHGAFRSQSSPDAPGRPRPRAPGNGPRPA